jgi:hypothetical protein
VEKQLYFWIIVICIYDFLSPGLLRRVADLVTLFMLVSCLTYSSTLKMEAVCSSETPVYFQLSTQLCIPEDRTVHNLRREIAKYYELRLA